MLRKSSIPLDQAWPFVILWLRGIKDSTILSVNQKIDLQRILLEILQQKDFSEAMLEETEKSIHAIITANYLDQIRALMKEMALLTQSMHGMFDEHRKDIDSMITSVDSDLQNGVNSEIVLEELRISLRTVMNKVVENVNNLKQMSYRDSLTGLANRRSFNTFLQKSIKTWEEDATPLSLILLDIDYFKKINDKYGHDVGDQVLQKLSEQLHKIFHPLMDRGDVIVARYGGEEFAVVLTGESSLMRTKFAEMIWREVQKLVVTGFEDNDRVPVTVSVGVATMHEGWDSDALISFTDKALYKAKNDGRNRIVQYVMPSGIFEQVIEKA